MKAKNSCSWLPIIALVIASSASGSDEAKTASITVKPDGVTCVVQGNELRCADVPVLLTTQFKLSPFDEITVTTESCTDAARKRADQVANGLRTAGFRHVMWAGCRP